MSLFDAIESEDTQKASPLADRMRPTNFDELFGQEHIIGKDTVLRKAIESGKIPSMVLWGPPGSGKTTLAHIIAKVSKNRFIPFSAVVAGVREVKEIVREAAYHLRTSKKRTVLFVDEIHRFNRAQQDYFLPHIEKGTIILIGATTENPSFEVNPALLSRLKVYVLTPLSSENIALIIRRTLLDRERGFGTLLVQMDDELITLLAELSQGDARFALNTLELAIETFPHDAAGSCVITSEILDQAMQQKPLHYDRAYEEHYNLISALHKSLRDSQPDAALYWLARMLESGEDPLYIARRMIRFASEDIGNSDPQALQLAISAKDAVHFLGMPEANLALAQAAIYLATAPKSNSLYAAYSNACRAIKTTGSLPVPMHIRNAPTKLMHDIGYGKGYKYAHDYTDRIVDQDDMPPELRGTKFYEPSLLGFEKTIKKRIDWWEKRRQELRRLEKTPGEQPS